MTTFERSDSGRIRFREDAAARADVDPAIYERLMKTLDRELPLVIYPEFRAITACWRTRNYTFYPKESLVGDLKTGSGYRSAIYPYQIPILRDHMVNPACGRHASPVYGRAVQARFVSESNGGGYTSIIAAITDPEAIRKTLTREFLTSSVGINTDSVHCGICGADLTEDGPEACGHQKGQPYTVGGKDVIAYWRIGPVFHEELSYVNSPSDVNSGIITPDIGVERLRVLAQESFESGTVIDISNGAPFREEYLTGLVPGPRRVWAFGEAARITTTRKESSPMPDTNTEALLTLGELYGLDPADEDYGKESKLTTKQRDDMPAGEFCGPGRSFPAGDLNHIRVGLGMVSKYKGPGNKTEIRACLLAKLKKHGGGKDADGKDEAVEPLVILHDETAKVDVPLFPGMVDPVVIAEAIGALGLPEEQLSAARAGLKSLCETAGMSVPESLADVSTEGVAPTRQIVFPVTETNWRVLYRAIENQQDTEWLYEAIHEHLAEYRSQRAAITRELAAASGETAQKLATAEAQVAELKTEVASLRENQGADGKTVEELTARHKTELDEAKAKTAAADESVAALQEQVTKLHAEGHYRLAEQVAMLKVQAGRAVAKGKDLAALTAEHVKRTKASLVDDLNELMVETANGSARSATQVVTIPNPTIRTDETNGSAHAPTDVVLDPATGRPTVNTGVTETDEGQVFLVGVDPKKFLERTNAERAKLGLAPIE